MEVEVKHRFRFHSVGFRFDAMSVFLMCQKYNVDLDSLGKIPQDEYMTAWAWCAHMSYCIPKYRKPMSFEKMKRFIAHMPKSEWDIVLGAMVNSRSEGGGDKKKVQPGGNSSSQDGRQD